LQENGLTDLRKLGYAAQNAKNAKNDFNATQSEIHAIDMRLKQISMLQKHIGTYRKTRDVFIAYGKSCNKEKFYAEHEADIEKHQSAKAYFDRINLGKLPTIAALKQEYARLSVEKKVLYKDYHAKRDMMKRVLTVEQNAKLMLDGKNVENERKHERDER